MRRPFTCHAYRVLDAGAYGERHEIVKIAFQHDCNSASEHAMNRAGTHFLGWRFVHVGASATLPA